MKKISCASAAFALLLGSLALTGCGPTAEERTVLDQFNQLPELIEKGGYVKTFERFEGQEEKVFVVEAEIVNAEDVPIGRLRSERVEGFGTRKPRIQWYETPGVREEWKVQPRRGRRDQQGERRGPEGQGGEGRGPGQGGQRQETTQQQPAS